MYIMHITKNTHTLQNPHKHTHYKPHSYTHTRIQTLQNNIKPPQYKLKQNAYKKSNSTYFEKWFMILRIQITQVNSLIKPQIIQRQREWRK
jgi:hypothetical protein